MNTELIEQLKARAYQLRILTLEATTQAGSGHPTSSLSAADIVAALFFNIMQFNVENPLDPQNDRFILSKGHAIPVVYAAWEQLGVLSYNELLGLRTFSSELEGHPSYRFLYNDAATGSLGCGLSVGLGMALSGQLRNLSFFTYVLLGDSEMSEGSVWEAAELAAHYKVTNLIALVDLNRLGQSTETLDDHKVAQHALRWKAFGWNTLEIDGHDMDAIVAALTQAKTYKEGPTVIVARTLKGYGLDGIEDKPGFHGKAFSHEELPKLLHALKQRFPQESQIRFERKSVKRAERKKIESPEFLLPEVPYKRGINKATRKAYGETLALLGEYIPDIVALDAEVKNSTFAELFEHKFPKRFFQCFVAEQNMVGMATGFAARGYIPFTSTFACFFSRAHDQIRMAAIGKAPLRLAGSHAGVSIGQDGPSQMGLDDIAMMRAIPESIILYPCDAISTFALVSRMATYNEGISYIRLTRSDTPILYDEKETFVIGGCKVLKESKDDVLCVVAAGITVFEALKAYEMLKEKNIFVSLIDVYSVKPLDSDTLTRQAHASNKRMITVEDHYIQGGIGESICSALKNEGIIIEMLAVKELPRSGSPMELLAYHRIDAIAILETVYKMLVP